MKNPFNFIFETLRKKSLVKSVAAELKLEYVSIGIMIKKELVQTTRAITFNQWRVCLQKNQSKTVTLRIFTE